MKHIQVFFVLFHNKEFLYISLFYFFIYFIRLEQNKPRWKKKII